MHEKIWYDAKEMKKPIAVGFDFDGVIAYNPVRILRYPIAVCKEKLFHTKKTSFFIPQTAFQRSVWSLVFSTSVFPAIGVDMLRTMVARKEIRAYLITGRFSFMEEYLYRWLDAYEMRAVFSNIIVNREDIQPHIFKKKAIEKHNLMYYVEDNYDVVSYLSKTSEAETLWIYNILDRGIPYPYKYPYLQKALEHIHGVA